ncbi:hypothetical protein ACPA1H_23480 [Ectopseudomonas chengduensis]
MRQTCILILGMHRSGTSALSGVLNILGVDLGSHLMQPKAENPKGFFENDLIFEVNEDLLAQAGSSVHDDFFNESKIDNIYDLDKLKSVLLEEFKLSKLFSIKDPRIGYLLPVYIQALKALDIDIKVIVPIRSPLEVARSLQVRNGFSLEKGLLHWAYHFLVVEKFSRALPRVFTSFEELIQAPRKTIGLIEKNLGLDLLRNYELKKELVHDFLTPDLKHHTIAMDNALESLPKILQDIVCLLPKLNALDISKELDLLRIQLFENQALFYNSNVIGIFNEYIQIEEILKVKDYELIHIKQELNAKDQSLEQIQIELQSKERELLLADQKLQEKAQVLEYAKQGLQVKDQLLEDALQKARYSVRELQKFKQELQSVSQELELSKQKLQANEQELINTKQRLQEKDQTLRLQISMRDQDFNNAQEKISELNHELLTMYKSRSWRMTRALREVKRKFFK